MLMMGHTGLVSGLLELKIMQPHLEPIGYLGRRGILLSEARFKASDGIRGLLLSFKPKWCVLAVVVVSWIL
jgi:hypothetical protein